MPSVMRWTGGRHLPFRGYRVQRVRTCSTGPATCQSCHLSLMPRVNLVTCQLSLVIVHTRLRLPNTTARAQHLMPFVP